MTLKIHYGKNLILALALGLTLTLGACAGKETQPAPAAESAPATAVAPTPAVKAGEQMPDPEGDLCIEAWTFAPGNFVLDVAGGADVFLVPEVQDFPLYCSPAKAREALGKMVAHGDLPEANGGWAIYRVEGVFHNIARAEGYGNYMLKEQARLVDWVQ